MPQFLQAANPTSKYFMKNNYSVSKTVSSEDAMQKPTSMRLS